MLRGRIERVVIPVADQEAGLSFYRSMLATEGMPVSKGRTYFDLGNVLLCVYSPIDDGDAPVGPLSVPVYVTVDEPSVWFDRLSAIAHKNLTPIEQRPWGEMSFYCTDPFGNVLCIVERQSMYRGEFFVE